MKTYFNSSVDREDYAVLRSEAYHLGVTIKQHISDIIHNYVEARRKEEGGAVKREEGNGLQVTNY